MTFSSVVFLFIFLPVTFLLYTVLKNHTARNVLLAAASLIFYAFGEPIAVFIMIGSIILNYIFGLAVSKEKHAKLMVMLAAILNIGMLFAFKYTGFFMQTLKDISGADLPVPSIRLPIGISFFTFQGLSYVIDVYRDKRLVQKSLFSVLLYISFFPQLIAGPIVRYEDIAAQIRDREFSSERVSRGIRRFIFGLGKKVLIANQMGIIADTVFSYAPSDVGFFPSWVGAVCYTLQIFFDFSGYSDMAIGVSSMFNIELPMNFNSPYKALSITDFWKRWHMSLTNFLTRYIYIPLGGNRKGTVRTYLNIMTVFLISGIWHGANWTFILWGVIHGFFQCINRAGKGLYESIVSEAKKLPAAPVFTGIIKAVSWLVTFIIVNVAWLLFRSDSITQFIQLMKRLTVYNYDIRTELLESFRIPKIRYLFAAVGADPSDMFTLGFCTVAVMAASLVMVLFFPNTGECRYRKNISNVIVTSVIFVICVVSLSRVSTFLYSNF